MRIDGFAFSCNVISLPPRYLHLSYLIRTVRHNLALLLDQLKKHRKSGALS
jgi:N-dimethylarginine dimethylaminohydrolase